jgi:N-acetylglucosaminyl-diphospho-decaprenol L-rhamnosyltransferase
MDMRLGVIVVTYNSGGVLPDCLTALGDALCTAQTEIPVHAQVVVVDNASDVPPRELLVRGAKATVLYQDENIGFSPAVNVGLRHLSKVDHVLLLNPDARLEAEALFGMLREALRTDAALVGPLLLEPSGEPSPLSERPFHALWREALHQLHLYRRRATPPTHGTVRARCLSGACLLARSDFLREVGGLDEAVPMYLEDVELSYQAAQRKRTAILAADSRCHHALGGSSGGKNFETSLALYLTLLSARVEFHRRRGKGRAGIARTFIAIGSLLRLSAGFLLRDGQLLRRSRHALVWSLLDGAPAPWDDGPVLVSSGHVLEN